MSIDITISHVKNASRLDEFQPVTGHWEIHGDWEDRRIDDVEQSVKNWMDAEYEITVRVFHADGREITSDVPSEGTFIARRK